MRTTADRIRHAISFEVIGLALIIPLGALAFHLPLHDVGVVTVASSIVATGWNYLYNLLFDHALRRFTGRLTKSVLVRVVHAVLFELGLLLLLMPFIALYLGISLWDALVMDLALALFYMGYAFAFNWLYDRVFPLTAAVP